MEQPDPKATGGNLGPHRAPSESCQQVTSGTSGTPSWGTQPLALAGVSLPLPLPPPFAKNVLLDFPGTQTRTPRLRCRCTVRLSSEDTRREAQGSVLLQNQAERQELLDRKLPQLKLEPVTRLGQVLGNAGSSHQGAWAKAEGRRGGGNWKAFWTSIHKEGFV